MITDEELEASLAEMEILAGIEPEAPAPPENTERVDRIVEKALYQAVMKDSISFVFHGFSTALAGISTGLLGISGGRKQSK